MALVFTDEQIREATGQALDAAVQIELYKNQKQVAIKLKQDFKDLDDANAVYTSFYNDVALRYHTELQYLNGLTRSLSSTAAIDAGGQLAPGNIYFPTSPVWMFFQPKIQSADNGLPTTPFANTETARMAAITPLITLMKSGFVSGSASQSTTAVSSGSVEVDDPTGFSSGQKFVCYSPSGYAYGTITSVVAGVTLGDPSTINCTITYGNLAGTGTGSTFTNHDPGFTLTERETNTGVSASRLSWLDGLRDLLDAAVTDFKGVIHAEVTALSVNGDTSTSGAQNAAAMATDIFYDNKLSAWLSAPDTGTGVGRFGNLMDTEVTGTMDARTAFIPGRISEITASLGSVAQSGTDGTLSGNGTYYKYLTTLNLRINKTGGTLRNFYQQDFVIQSFDQRISLAQDSTVLANETFMIKEFSADGDGSERIKLKDTNNLATSMEVKIMTNTKSVITAFITLIDGLEVVLDQPVPVDYLASDRARLVVQL